MSKYYLAIDIGASSGRHILGHTEDGRIVLEEVYRFDNKQVQKNGHDCWDMDNLWNGILGGLKKCREIGKIPATIGIDTWAVDFVLLDENGAMIGDAVAYRDGRTQGADKIADALIPAAELYARAGIQKQIFNTIYQLLALQKEHPEQLSEADAMLMIPDYFGYLLTGVKKQEYTNATSTNLVNAAAKTWDMDLIRRLGLPEKLFTELSMPGTVVGNLTEEIQKEVGFDAVVILPATHDTGSAFLAVPAKDDNAVYLSSGTWSLLGVENKEPICTEASRRQNFTNEGGAWYCFRYLKNIMGLWMIQSVRHEYGDRYSFDEICRMAEESKDFPSLVDVQDNCFLSPDSMCESIRTWCEAHGLKVPQTLGEIASVVYRSLAACYAQTAKELETLNGKQYPVVQVVGGGSQAEYLNQLTADALGKTVYAGPTEASAIGNIIVQMWGRGGIGSLDEARQIVGASFPVKVFQPRS